MKRFPTLRPRHGLIALSLILLTGCTSMKPADFATATPKLVLEDYFAGQTRAWGLFEDRFGTVRRQFTVDITGDWDGNRLVLDEHFLYNDGETDRRVWTIRKTADGSYIGLADDVIGRAEGTAAGNALNWAYTMDLKVGDGTVRVRFDDWMFLQPDNVMINRAKVTKWGFDIGEVTLFFQKQTPPPAMAGDA